MKPSKLIIWSFIIANVGGGIGVFLFTAFGIEWPMAIGLFLTFVFYILGIIGIYLYLKNPNKELRLFKI